MHNAAIYAQCNGLTASCCEHQTYYCKERLPRRRRHDEHLNLGTAPLHGTSTTLGWPGPDRSHNRNLQSREHFPAVQDAQSCVVMQMSVDL